jgi:hypothetical protein
VVDCVDLPEFSNSSTSPFVSKQKRDVSGQLSKRGQSTTTGPFGVKRRILGLVRSRHFIGQPLPCMKRAAYLIVDAHMRSYPLRRTSLAVQLSVSSSLNFNAVSDLPQWGSLWPLLRIVGSQLSPRSAMNGFQPFMDWTYHRSGPSCLPEAVLTP